jgi:Protein of unknown function (DUF3048) N-terminal domain/Protein of unknown function (DUF3048) C-terminal domain
VKKPLILVTILIVVIAGALLWPKVVAKLSPTSITTIPSYSIAPLTGLPDVSGNAVKRPALTVKIENTPDSMPQWGITKADVVYEEIVNGGITRLAAIFNSSVPTKIGPVRSVRPTDTQIVYPLGGIFAFSGGAQYAINSIETAPVKLLNQTSAGLAMYRDPKRQAPHNLYAVGESLFAFGGTPTPPNPIFTYRVAGKKVKGTSVSTFTVNFPSIYPVTWSWNTTSKSWDRSIFGSADITGTGERESPKNVIDMFVNYVNGIGTMNSYGDLQGSGTAQIFTAGKEVQATWSRGPLKSDPVIYKTLTGKVVALTPGQTWVELINTGAKVTVTP